MIRHVWLYVVSLSLVGLLSLFATAGDIGTRQLFKADTELTGENHGGEQLFDKHCASCHDGALPKAPHRELLQTMSVNAILVAITDGIMRQQGAGLHLQEKQAVAEYLSQQALADYQPPPMPPRCEGSALAFDLTSPPALAGWGYDNKRFISPVAAGIDAADLGKLTLKWALGFPDASRARSQPVVALGAVFMGSQDGTIYALDLATGCARWTKNVGAEVRTAVVVEPTQSNDGVTGTEQQPPRLFFGDLLGRVYAMNALNGDVLWRISAGDHANTTITGTPALHKNTLYVPVSSLESATAANPDFPCCTSRGSVIAVDIATGNIVWRHNTIEQTASLQGRNNYGTVVYGPSGAAVWNSPTIDVERQLIYHGSGQNYSQPADNNSDAVFAVNLMTGQRVWRQQLSAEDVWVPTCIIVADSCQSPTKLDSDIGASVLLLKSTNVDKPTEVLVAAQKSGWVYGLDPQEQGRVLWRQSLGRGGLFGGVHFGMAAEGMRVYVPISDTPDRWDGKPVRERGFPGLHALDAKTGDILWRAVAVASKCQDKKFCNPGISAAVTAMTDAVIAGHLDGMLRAYDGATGQVVWQTDTTEAVLGVNGVMAKGGSISGPGAAIANGHVIINSGYGFGVHEPGNALLVYSINGQ